MLSIASRAKPHAADLSLCEAIKIRAYQPPPEDRIGAPERIRTSDLCLRRFCIDDLNIDLYGFFIDLKYSYMIRIYMHILFSYII